MSKCSTLPTRRPSPTVVVLAAAAYAAGLSWLSIERYRTFHAGVDLGIFTQTLFAAVFRGAGVEVLERR